jgi:hypothetical protein
MVSSSQLEQRVADLEVAVASLQRKLDNLDTTVPWWEKIAGSFENDPINEKAMQLGREYRQSLRPKAAPRRKWMAYIARLRSVTQQVETYRRLHRQLGNYCRIAVLTFDAPAAVRFQQLRRARLRIETMDLKIAAIVLSHEATLLSRNLADFGQVPDLRVEDWTA